MYLNKTILLFIWILGATNETEELLLHQLHADALPCYHTALSSLLRNFRKRSLSIASRIYMKTGENRTYTTKQIYCQGGWYCGCKKLFFFWSLKIGGGRYTSRYLSTGRDFGLSSLSWLHAHVTLLCYVVTETYRLHVFLSIAVILSCWNAISSERELILLNAHIVWETVSHVKTLLIECGSIEQLFLLLYRPWTVKYTLLCVKMSVFAGILINIVGLKWKQTAEKENVKWYIGYGQLLKWQQSNIPAVCHLC